MCRKHSITAEARKHPPLTHSMGVSPIHPYRAPPRTGPSRLARASTWATAPLAATRPSGGVRAGMLACTAG